MVKKKLGPLFFKYFSSLVTLNMNFLKLHKLTF